jgi:hypothetical protein
VLALIVGAVYVEKSGTTADGATTAPNLDAYHLALDDATTQRRIGAVALGSGVVLGAISAYLFVRHGREHHGPIVSSDGRSIHVGVAF